MNCDKKGKVNIQLFDLQGNSLWNNEAVKNSFQLIVPINTKLSSGSYFIRVNFDNVIYYYNKIIVIN
jgi:hypothetical protein